MIRSTNKTHLAASALIALGLAVGLASCGYSPVIPKGPTSTKTGYSVSYKLNGRTDHEQLEAEGGIPTAGNVTFRDKSYDEKADTGKKAE